MSAFTAKVTPGFDFADGEELTPDILRQIANPTVDIEGTIAETSIADGAVTTQKLADGAVTTGKIAAAAVATTNIIDQAVTAGKIANATITTTQIAAATILGSNLAAATVTPANLQGTAVMPAGSSRGLVVKPNAGAPLSKLQATAAGIILADNTGLTFQAPAVNVTGDITASGANGLDTGGEANSTWYYLFVIYNPTTPQTAALLSASKTAPTLPAGYTFAALVGAVFNSSGGDFSDVITYGAATRYDSAPQACTLSTPVTFPHNLGVLPTIVDVCLVCTTGELNYAIGDEVPVTTMQGSGTSTAISMMRNATNVVAIVSGNAVFLLNKTTGAESVLGYTGSTLTNWKLVAHAILA